MCREKSINILLNILSDIQNEEAFIIPGSFSNPNETSVSTHPCFDCSGILILNKRENPFSGHQSAQGENKGFISALHLVSWRTATHLSTIQSHKPCVSNKWSLHYIFEMIYALKFPYSQTPFHFSPIKRSETFIRACSPVLLSDLWSCSIALTPFYLADLRHVSGA